VNLTAATYMNIRGVVDSSGLGPLYGVGSPALGEVTQGGSYGGSGGRVQCNGTYFSNTANQVCCRFLQCNSRFI
jgi:hypothetical protein